MTRDELAAFVINEIDDIVYVVDAETDEVLFMNEKGKRMFGAEQVNFEDTHVLYYKLLYGSDRAPADCALEIAKREGNYSTRIHDPKYDKYHFCKYKFLQMGNRGFIVGVFTDTTGICRAANEIEQRLQTEETLIACIRTLYENRNVETAIHELLKIVADYHKAERAYIFEIRPTGDLLDNTYEWCAPGITPQIDLLQEIEISVIDRWMKQFEEKGEFYITSLDGDVDENSEEYRILQQQNIDSLMAAPLKMEDKIVGFLGVDNPGENTDTLVLMRSVAAFIINDFQKRKTLADLYEQSLHDRLTGVGNRHAYVQYMSEIEGSNNSLGIIFADINGLKKANDKYGHEYGDNMIREVAEILKHHFTEHIYRIGGDEFVVFVPNISETDFNERITFLKSSWTENVAAAVGVMWLEQCVDIEKQVAGADRLMYLDKQAYYKKNV